MSKQIVAVTLALAMTLTPCTALGEPPPALPQGGSPDQQMDQLLAPIALYPDALLAQTLACATSPDQVHEVSQWLNKNGQLQGSDLQKAAEQAGFDASFVAIVLFPDVLKLLEDNKPWTTELGKAFLSDQKAVLASAQRLRQQAKTVGNLKTTPQQEVKTDTSSGQQVIVIQPANPQVVYVPQYDPQTVYTSPPPQQQQQQQSSGSGNAVAAGLIGFTAGILLGAAVNNNNYGYYGWGAWGCSWHSSAVIVRGGAWRVPPVPRYPYVRPVAGYRAPANVYAPRYSNVNASRNRNVNRNVNVNNVNVNVNPQNRNVNSARSDLNRTQRPTTATSARETRPAQSTAATRQPRTAANTSDYASRGRSAGSASASPSPARQMESGSRTSAFSGYQSGSAERQASSRGSRSSGSSGGHRRR